MDYSVDAFEWPKYRKEETAHKKPQSETWVRSRLLKPTEWLFKPSAAAVTVVTSSNNSYSGHTDEAVCISAHDCNQLPSTAFVTFNWIPKTLFSLFTYLRID